MSSQKLDALKERMAAKKTKAFLVVRGDKIVCEWYAPGHSATHRHGTASLAKALAGGLPLAVALTDGKIALDDSAAKFVPEWKKDPRKAKITIRHLGSHTSGLEDAEADGLPHEQLTGWKGDFWKRLDPPRDPFTLARDIAPVLFEPGEKLQYSNPGIGMLTYCVTAAIQQSEHKDIRTLLRERVMRPIGVLDEEWSVGYGKTFMVDSLPVVGTWGGGNYTARAAARIGRLVLREGDWEGRRILSKEAVRGVTGDAGLPGRCGMGWWSNAAGRYRQLPQDAVWGAGAGDQLLLVIPSLNLIMVRNGQTLEPGPGEPPVSREDVFTRYHDYRARILFEPLAEAVINRTARISGSASPPRDVAAKVLTERGPNRVSVVEKEEGFLFQEGDSKVLFYQLKPKSLNGSYERANYVHPLYDLGGNTLTEDFPKDHPHQRGVFWAWHHLSVDGRKIADSWALQNWNWEAAGTRILPTAIDSAALEITGLWKSPLWKDPQGNLTPVVKEMTRIRAFRAERNLRKIDFEIQLLALQPNVRFGGSEDEKGYGGFSVRVRLPENVQFSGQRGPVTPELGSVETGPWLNVLGTFQSASTPSGLAVLGHPSNPGSPHRWVLRREKSMQNAAYPGREPVLLSTAQPLVLRYRLLIHDGTLTAAELDALQRAYAAVAYSKPTP